MNVQSACDEPETLKPMLEDFFSWARGTCKRLPDESSPGSQSEAKSGGSYDGYITLVANYGGAYDFANLIDSLEGCEMLQDVLSIRLCDSLVPFKAKFGVGNSCALRELAARYCPALNAHAIGATDVLAFAQALRAVAPCIFAPPESKWRATSTPLGSYASRLGLISYTEPVVKTEPSSSSPKRARPAPGMGLVTPPQQPGKRPRYLGSAEPHRVYHHGSSNLRNEHCHCGGPGCQGGYEYIPHIPGWDACEDGSELASDEADNWFDRHLGDFDSDGNTVEEEGWSGLDSDEDSSDEDEDEMSSDDDSEGTARYGSHASTQPAEVVHAGPASLRAAFPARAAPIGSPQPVAGFQQGRQLGYPTRPSTSPLPQVKAEPGIKAEADIKAE